MGENEASPRHRSPKDLLRLRRGLGQSHFRTQKHLHGAEALPGKGRIHRLWEFSSVRVLRWVGHYLKTRIGGKAKFKTYKQSGANGIHKLRTTAGDGSSSPQQDEIKISLAGDWATGTFESGHIADQMRAFEPHYTIHLGDTYYVGTKKEIKENFFSLVRWPFGSVGSFSLNGNHEMYARGKAYFKYLLPELGILDPQTKKQMGQKASYFCLENDSWRIIGLDTGYNSVGFPLLEKVPLLKRLVGGDAKLPKPLIEWLRDEVKIEGDNRGIILLSHHQYYSAFEGGHDAPANQLAAFIHRPVLWFWGHEHRMAVYGNFSTSKGIEAYGRCIGHAGMPIEGFDKRPKDKKVRKYRLLVYDSRYQRRAGLVAVGYNGFANLTFKGNRLKVDYRDRDNRSLLAEEWEVILSTGKLNHVSFQPSPPGLTQAPPIGKLTP